MTDTAEAGTLEGERGVTSWDEAFSVVVLLEGDTATVIASGDVDAFTFPRLYESILAELRIGSVGRVVVDVSAVDFIDQRSMCELIRLTRSSAAEGKELILRHPAHRFMKLRGIIDTEHVLKIETA